ncbi:hypothetical protein V8G54_019623 [Vigna mungo]|uniref:Uncharacterized protein n=1 Tax=Vigna mungo TaxID=3915 RepID=A0AAQ3NBZ4_VIGMU
MPPPTLISRISRDLESTLPFRPTTLTVPNLVGCARLCCDLSTTILVWFSCFAGFWGWLRFLTGVEGEVEVACQDTKDDGDGVEEIAVFTVENGGEDELSRILSSVAIWVVDRRTKELSQWFEAARGGASMEVRRFIVVVGRRWLCS